MALEPTIEQELNALLLGIARAALTSLYRLPLTPGFALGGFVAMMSATFAYEDPLSRASQKIVGTGAQAKYIFRELGKNMWSSGKGFGKVGALYSGIECCIEGVSN